MPLTLPPRFFTCRPPGADSLRGVSSPVARHPALERRGTIAMAHRANKIAYAMVRDQQPWEPSRWAA